MLPALQAAQASPEVAVEEAVKHKLFAPTPRRILLVPSKVNKSPLVVSGERLLKAVVVEFEPVPPLATDKFPVTSPEAKLIAPLYNEPPAVERTGKA